MKNNLNFKLVDVLQNLDTAREGILSQMFFYYTSSVIPLYYRAIVAIQRDIVVVVLWSHGGHIDMYDGLELISNILQKNEWF